MFVVEKLAKFLRLSWVLSSSPYKTGLSLQNYLCILILMYLVLDFIQSA